MAQRKRPGATAKKERKARAEARKNAPKNSRRQMTESALATARERLEFLSESLFADENGVLESRIKAHIKRLEDQLSALEEA